MATELSPTYIQDISFERLAPEQFLVLIIDAAKKLNWNIGPVSEIGFIGYRKLSVSFGSEELKVEIHNYNAILESRYTGLQIVKEMQNKENIENLIATFMELKSTFNPRELDQRSEELKANFVPIRLSLMRHPPSSFKEDFLGIVKPRHGYYITPVLIDLNIIIFVLMIFSGVNIMLPDQDSLITWGANFTHLTLGGQWWRLLTCCFIHIGFLHLFFNMYALVYIGLLLEPQLGKTRFITAYILTGIAASITSLWWHDEVVSAGASGAIFGMYGVFLAMLTTNLIEKSSRKPLLTSIAVFVGFNLIGGMRYGIDNAAHLGGLISGIVIGYAYFPGLRKGIKEAETR